MSSLKAFDDSKFINKDTVKLYCNTNEEFLVERVRGIIVELPGLGGGSCLGGGMELQSYDSDFAIECGKHGVLVAYVFPGPWSWGNKGAIRVTDAVVRALSDKYELGEVFPLCVCGGSMGGEGSLNYACDTKLNLTACASACPACDLAETMRSYPDFPRTIISSVACYDIPLDAAIDSLSPINRIKELPDIPYYICSDGDDECCPSETCDRMVDEMKGRELKVIYRQQPGLKHGEFTSEVWGEIHEFLLNKALGK